MTVFVSSNDGVRYSFTTTRGQVVSAGTKFGLMLKILDGQGNIVPLTQDQELVWKDDAKPSGSGEAPHMPPSQFTCSFIAGRCTTREEYFLTDSSVNLVHIWVGDGPGGLEDVFNYPISVQPAVNH